MSLSGWAETLVIGVLALIIIGPKDLPKVLFTLGRIVGKLKEWSALFLGEMQNIQNLNDVESMNHKREKSRND